MKRKPIALLGLAVLAALLAAGAAWGAFSITGQWLLEGGGHAKRGSLRVSLKDSGHVEFTGHVRDDGIEVITGYKIDVKLEATMLGIKAWSYSDTVVFSTPVPLPLLEPTVNDPFVFPDVTVDRVSYRLAVTSATSGTVKIWGIMDVDGVGDVDIDSDSAIWKRGTPMPYIPDTESGCNASSLPAAALLAAAAGALVLRRR